MTSSDKEDKNYTAAILIVGNEILSGRTQDSNLNFLAKELSNLGIALLEVRVVSDKKISIMRALNELRKKYTYVFTTGGLGPTHDDITTESIAKALKLELYRDENAVSMIKEHYHEANKALDETAFRMSYLPEGATLLLNDVSGAPGFKIKNIFALAGVPEVMSAMFNYAKIYLKTSSKFISKSIRAVAGESKISILLEQLQKKHKDLEIGSYPFKYKGKWCTHLVIRGKKEGKLADASKELEKSLKKNKIEFFEEGVKV
ncbi:MAG: competence/damage-inducible protein A [Rickettsiales bacterium]|nr:competence/damage-inducible protein A [Rickettsiales bacterium]